MYFRMKSAPLRYGKMSSSWMNHGVRANTGIEPLCSRIISRTLSHCGSISSAAPPAACSGTSVACPSITACAASTRSSSPLMFWIESRFMYWSCNACTSSCCTTKPTWSTGAPCTMYSSFVFGS